MHGGSNLIKKCGLITESRLKNKNKKPKTGHDLGDAGTQSDFVATDAPFLDECFRARHKVCESVAFHQVFALLLVPVATWKPHPSHTSNG